MNNKIKLALALVGAGTAVAWGITRKRKMQKKTFTAPDGNTYGENQIYRTFDNKLYKNGKEIHFETPTMDEHNSESHAFDEQGGSIPKNYESVNKNINYHQKGIRHH